MNHDEIDGAMGDVRMNLHIAHNHFFNGRVESAADEISQVIARLREIEKALRRACEEGGE